MGDTNKGLPDIFRDTVFIVDKASQEVVARMLHGSSEPAQQTAEGEVVTTTPSTATHTKLSPIQLTELADSVAQGEPETISRARTATDLTDERQFPDFWDGAEQSAHNDADGVVIPLVSVRPVARESSPGFFDAIVRDPSGTPIIPNNGRQSSNGVRTNGQFDLTERVHIRPADLLRAQNTTTTARMDAVYEEASARIKEHQRGRWLRRAMAVGAAVLALGAGVFGIKSCVTNESDQQASAQPSDHASQTKHSAGLKGSKVTTPDSVDRGVAGSTSQQSATQPEQPAIGSSVKVVRVQEGQSLTKITKVDLFGEQNGRLVDANPILSEIVRQGVQELQATNAITASRADHLAVNQQVTIRWSTEYQKKIDAGRLAIERLRA